MTAKLTEKCRCGHGRIFHRRSSTWGLGTYECRAKTNKAGTCWCGRYRMEKGN